MTKITHQTHEDFWQSLTPVTLIYIADDLQSGRLGSIQLPESDTRENGEAFRVAQPGLLPQLLEWLGRSAHDRLCGAGKPVRPAAITVFEVPEPKYL